MFEAPDAIDACDEDFTGDDELADDEVVGFVLFADVAGDDEAIERRRQEYEELFG
jgi:hypothetical protein